MHNLFMQSNNATQYYANACGTIGAELSSQNCQLIKASTRHKPSSQVDIKAKA